MCVHPSATCVQVPRARCSPSHWTVSTCPPVTLVSYIHLSTCHPCVLYPPVHCPLSTVNFSQRTRCDHIKGNGKILMDQKGGCWVAGEGGGGGGREREGERGSGISAIAIPPGLLYTSQQGGVAIIENVVIAFSLFLLTLASSNTIKIQT